MNEMFEFRLQLDDDWRNMSTNRRQATNADPVDRRIYAAVRGCELKPDEITSLCLYISIYLYIYI